MGRFEEALTAFDETIERFPQDVFAPTGRAEVLKEMGRFEEALGAYEKISTDFPQNVVARSGRANLLVLMDRFMEVRSILSEELLISSHDWIGYHILAMSYLKANHLDEAIKRLEFGLENSPRIKNKHYFANALVIARIRKKEFAEAVNILEIDLPGLNLLNQHKHLLFLSHSQAELGKKEEAKRTLSRFEKPKSPRILNLKDNLENRYDLNGHIAEKKSDSDIELLDKNIEDEEFYLALAA